jgi:hypothetical protein
MEGGYDDFQKRLQNPDDRARIARHCGRRWRGAASAGSTSRKSSIPRRASTRRSSWRDRGDDADLAGRRLMTLFAQNNVSPRVIY